MSYSYITLIKGLILNSIAHLISLLYWFFGTYQLVSVLSILIAWMVIKKAAMQSRVKHLKRKECKGTNQSWEISSNCCCGEIKIVLKGDSNADDSLQDMLMKRVIEEDCKLQLWTRWKEGSTLPLCNTSRKKLKISILNGEDAYGWIGQMEGISSWMWWDRTNYEKDV